MADPRAFISFDFDHDSDQRVLFAGQSKHSKTPFSIQDWSSKEELAQSKWEAALKAKRMAELLKTNEDGSPNFECRVLTGPPLNIGRAEPKSRIKELFINKADVALLYFSGHGTKDDLGGYLVTQDAQQHDEGVPMSEVITLANESNAQEVVILLDCCHSGALGDLPGIGDKTLLREGVSILTASRGSQVAVEIAGGGVFTSLLCAALEGGASDVLGKVTIAGIYAYVDQSLGAWDQRPLFKALVSKLTPLRTCNPVVPFEILRRLPEYSETAELQLDPSFEPDADPKHPEHEAIFKNCKDSETRGCSSR
jgi:hypothetical protein